MRNIFLQHLYQDLSKFCNLKVFVEHKTEQEKRNTELNVSRLGSSAIFSDGLTGIFSSTFLLPVNVSKNSNLELSF